MLAHQPDVVLETPMQLGECPLWHPRESALYWIDIEECAVHRYNPTSHAHHMWPMPSEPGCIAWCISGGLVVALRSGLHFLDTTDGSLRQLLSAPYDQAIMRFNDGRCDAQGRLWVGTIYEPRDQALAPLFCIERGALRDSGNRVTVSNGVAFSIDRRTLYHADTTAHKITAYDFDVATGQLGASRVFRQFSMDKSQGYAGRPDGAAVDVEDAYWCAMYEGGRLLRLSAGGEVLTEVPLPARCPTMIAFGGADLRTLYITTARYRRSEAELLQYPLSGCVLSIRVEVPGCLEPGYTL
jgi:sugar lactone lactonase YvrE